MAQLCSSNPTSPQCICKVYSRKLYDGCMKKHATQLRFPVCAITPCSSNFSYGKNTCSTYSWCCMGWLFTITFYVMKVCRRCAINHLYVINYQNNTMQTSFKKCQNLCVKTFIPLPRSHNIIDIVYLFAPHFHKI